MRTSRDIDILVAPRDAPAALVVLEAMGFYRRDAEAALPELMRLRKDVELLHDGRRQIIELHWRLFDNPCLLPLLPDMVPGRVLPLARNARCCRGGSTCSISPTMAHSTAGPGSNGWSIWRGCFHQWARTVLPRCMKG